LQVREAALATEEALSDQRKGELDEREAELVARQDALDERRDRIRRDETNLAEEQSKVAKKERLAELEDRRLADRAVFLCQAMEAVGSAFQQNRLLEVMGGAWNSSELARSHNKGAGALGKQRPYLSSLVPLRIGKGRLRRLRRLRRW
jgi:uncharacterized protein (DUF3084 family)